MMDEYAKHYRAVAEQYRLAGILVRGDLTAWKHERSVQAAADRDRKSPPCPDYYRADGAINAINHLSAKADCKREKFEALAAAAERGDQAELDRLLSDLR